MGPSKAEGPDLADSSLSWTASAEANADVVLQQSQSGLSRNIFITETGRAPWYNAQGKPIESYVIGVAGGSASGKTSVARAILKSLPNVPWVGIISQDSFYKPLTKEQSKAAFRNEYDFDHPNAFDFDILRDVVRDLRQCKSVELPNYSFVEHNRLPQTTYMYGPTVLIVEGIFVLHDPELRELLDLKIFVQADSDLMLARRIRRDIAERGRDVNGVLDQYLRFVKPSYDNFIGLTNRHADIVVPGQNNSVAMSVIAEHIKRQLGNRAMKVRNELSQAPASHATPAQESLLLETHEPSSAAAYASRPPLGRGLTSEAIGGAGPAKGLQSMSRTASAIEHGKEDSASVLPPNVILLPQTPQLRGLLTIFHDEKTAGEDFIFTVDRIATLVMETALSFLPYRPKEVPLWNGKTYMGTELATDLICSVSILRSGGVLQSSARRALPALDQGSILIQSQDSDGEAQLYTVDLPPMLQHRSTASQAWVLLLDSQISSGAAAFMAIRVLLDHGVAPSRILFLSLLASLRGGLQAIQRAFPEVRIVVAGVDPGLSKRRVPKSSEEMRRTRMSSAGGAGQDAEDETRICYSIEPGAGNIGSRYWL